MGRRRTEFKGKLLLPQASKQKKSEIDIACEKLFEITSSQINEKQLWENYLEMSSILESIIKLEKTETQSLERSNVINSFTEWLKENGAKFDGLSICNFTGYNLGLRADVDVPENELIIKIPRELIFNVQTAAKEIKEMESDIIIQHMPQVALAIALLIEKQKKNSKWKPYLDILPKEYYTVLYFDINDMLELKGYSSAEPVLKQCRNVVRQYSYFKRLFRNGRNAVCTLLKDSFTYEEYRWAVSTVMTRQNLIPREDNSQMINSLIPMWDMCNHQEGKITTDFNCETNCCECYAMRNFKSGEQIFIYYGQRTNTDFFVHSGFVYPDNKSDGFNLRLGISKHDPLQSERLELLSRLDLPGINDYFLSLEPNPLSGKILSFLRVFNMDKDELNRWLNSKEISNITRNDYKLNEELDTKVFKFIINRLQLLMLNYRTTIQEDEDLISTMSQDCRILALKMRLSEKQTLQRILTNLQTLNIKL